MTVKWFAFFFRTEFILDESGDVSWKVSEDVDPLPFFNCETYEVINQDFYAVWFHPHLVLNSCTFKSNNNISFVTVCQVNFSLSYICLNISFIGVSVLTVFQYC